MRIKRFIAPDMRTALRMVREEQGPDAVILSNRPVDGGIEVVAATDYDESLAQQALRAAVPALASAPSKPVPMPASTPTPMAVPTRVDAAPAAAAGADDDGYVPSFLRTAARSGGNAAMQPPPIPESRIRGRAVFAIGEAPPSPETATTVTPAVVAVASAPCKPDTSRFEAMMAALIPARERLIAPALEESDDLPQPSPGRCAPGPVLLPQAGEGEANPLPRTPSLAREGFTPLPPAEEGQAAPSTTPGAGSGGQGEGHARTLRAVDTPPTDPALAAMRDELATMRQLIERELGQFAVERLRGSPARAAAFDALLGYGCDETLAQTVAAALDARLDPAQVLAPLQAELARHLAIARHEPIDGGGVIALVGPTGAGKTTTVAKLAARFAQRHRARDVALVTTDTERAGATEQLHILGRRLGITVCEANSANALGEALDQLADYPLVLVDTAGHGLRDRALLSQILWLRSAQRVRSLLVLPANTHPHDLGEVVRRYRPAAPEGVVLTKLDETGRLGSALSVLVQHGLSLAYTCAGQQVPSDLDIADATRLVSALEKVRLAAVNPLGSLDTRSLAAHAATLPTEDRHAIAR